MKSSNVLTTGMLRTVTNSACLFMRSHQRTVNLKLGVLLVVRLRKSLEVMDKQEVELEDCLSVVTGELMNGPVLRHGCSLRSLEADFKSQIEKH